MKKLLQYWQDLKNKKAPEITAWAFKEFGADKVALASSFGAEDQVLTDMMISQNRSVRIFTLDTGRLFQETYDTMQKSIECYGIRYEVYPPDPEDLSKMTETYGPNLFYDSIEKRKLCCRIRKLLPLKKAFKTIRAWICGIRREQSVTRKEIEPIEWDEENKIYKISPLFNWTEQEVWDYIKTRHVPYNALHDQGFKSIGCAPCTRAVQKGEDVRSGRWWWESPEHKECGLHSKKAVTGNK